METKEIFEQMASRYDTEERDQIAGVIADTIRAELTDTQDKQALDYGCGTGLVGLKLTDCFKSLLLVDTSQQMTRQVDKKIAQRKIENANTLCADFCEAVPQNIAVDCIFLSQVLLHVRDYPLLLRRLYRILNDDGHLLIVDFDKNENIPADMVHNGFVQAELMELLCEIGFVSTAAQTFYHGEKLFMKQDASLFLLNAGK